MLVTTKQKMYLTMHGLVDKGETIDIPEDVINDFGKDCFEFVGEVKPKGTETEPGNKLHQMKTLAMKIHQMKTLGTKSLRKQAKRKPILRKNKGQYEGCLCIPLLPYRGNHDTY